MHAENGSLYNTPPVFAIYMLGLVMRWLIEQGGLEAIAEVERAQGGQAVRRDRSNAVSIAAPRRRTAGR